jgi:hypothetical protein
MKRENLTECRLQFHNIHWAFLCRRPAMKIRNRKKKSLISSLSVRIDYISAQCNIWFDTFISSMNDGKPPMDMNVMKPDIKAPQAPLAKMDL